MTMPPQYRPPTPPPTGDGTLWYGDDMRTSPITQSGGGKTGIAPVKRTPIPPIGTVPTPRPVMPTRKPPVGVLPPPVRPVTPYSGGQLGGSGGGVSAFGGTGLADWDVSPVTKALAMRHLTNSGGGFGGGGGGLPSF